MLRWLGWVVRWPCVTRARLDRLESGYRDSTTQWADLVRGLQDVVSNERWERSRLASEVLDLADEITYLEAMHQDWQHAVDSRVLQFHRERESAVHKLAAMETGRVADSKKMVLVLQTRDEAVLRADKAERDASDANRFIVMLRGVLVKAIAAGLRPKLEIQKPKSSRKRARQ
jgi:hypothetical protein